MQVGGRLRKLCAVWFGLVWCGKSSRAGGVANSTMSDCSDQLGVTACVRCDGSEVRLDRVTRNSV
jgi:hypothetical protein